MELSTYRREVYVARLHRWAVVGLKRRMSNNKALTLFVVVPDKRAFRTSHADMKKRLSVVSILILTIGLLPMFINFENYLQLIDFVTQQIPFIIETKRMFESGSPWWSWNTFYGDNFIGCFSFYTVTSPFVWIACLFPYDKILWGILLALYLKIICTSVFSYIYFKRMQFGDRICCLGALLYTFSSFYICNLFYFHFCEPVMLFPLLLTAIENVIENRQRSYFWLSIVSFFITFINFYFAASTFMMGFIYYMFRAWTLSRLSFSNVVKTIASQFLGILLSSFILIPTILHNFGGSRASISTSLVAYLGFNSVNGFIIKYIDLALRLFLPMASERPETFFASGFSSTQGYIQLFGWLFAIVYCIRKRNWLSWILLILTICYITPIGCIFSLFTSTIYTRWLYGYVLMGILATLYFIKEQQQIKKYQLYLYIAAITGIIVVYCFIQYISSMKSGHEFTLNYVEVSDIVLWIINVCFLILYVCKPGINKAIIFAAICSILNLAAFTFHHFANNAENEISQRSLYAEYVQSQSQNRLYSDFEYRTDFESKYTNLPILLNRPGIISFHSVYNKQLIPFREIVDSNSTTPTVFIRNNREEIAALMSVKEVYISGKRNEENDTYDFGLNFREEKGCYKIYDYLYYIPMGFAYDSYVTESELQNSISRDSINVANIMLQSLIIEDSDTITLNRYLKHSAINDKLPLDSLSNARKKYTVFDFVGTTKGFTAKSKFDDDKVIFFSIAADPGFKATIDGQKTEIYKVNLGMSAIIVPSGQHIISFTYTPYGYYFGCIISACSMIMLLVLCFRNRRKIK